jgi:hypothetical protein
MLLVRSPLYPSEPDKNIKPFLDFVADTVAELVNFGCNMLEWDKGSKGGDENVAPVMLLRHQVELLDATSVLIRLGSGDPAKLLMRGLLETSLSLEYLLKENSHNRAMAFLFMDIIKQIKLMRKLDVTTSGDNILRVFERDGFSLDAKKAEHVDFAHEIALKEGVLRRPQFEPTYIEYQKLTKKYKNPSWFQFYDGPANVYELAKLLGKETLYEFGYRKWSGAIHATDVYLGRLSRNSEGGTDIFQIRAPNDVQSVARYGVLLTFGVFKDFVETRIPTHVRLLKRFYLKLRKSIEQIAGPEIFTFE